MDCCLDLLNSGGHKTEEKCCILAENKNVTVSKAFIVNGHSFWPAGIWFTVTSPEGKELVKFSNIVKKSYP